MATEVGLVELGSVTKWLSGGTPNRAVDHYWSGDIPWISASTLKESEVSSSDQCVTKEAVSLGSKMAPVNSTLLLVRGSALHNEIRAGLVVKPVCFNQDVKALIPSSNVYPKYLTYSILGRQTQLLDLVSSTGNTAGVLDTKLVQAFKIWVPDVNEQRAIAIALSDVDALIAGLEKLIAKKRDLKQAAMQQLLTCQTRLPGFSGEWVEKTLGEIGEISGAGVDKKIRFGEQPVRLLNYMDVYKRTFLKSSDFSHEVSAKPDQIKRCSVKAGDVFFTPTSEVREDIGHSAVAVEDMPDVAYSYHVVRLRIFDEWDLRFSAYPFQTKSFLDQASTTCEGSGTRYVITLPKFRALEILYPADKREQAAIASVLFDMDAEIVALETRLAKTRELKQGMMQELLTGRTRLV